MKSPQVADVQIIRARTLAKERALDVTASKVGALFGDSYNSAYAMWLAHRGEGVDDDEGDLDESPEYVRVGQAIEPAIAGLVRERLGWTLRKSTTYLRSPSLRIGATVDYYVMGQSDVGRGVLEIKNCSSWAWRDKWRDGELVPLRYQAQIQTQMALAGARWGAFGCLVAGGEIIVMPQKFDPAIWANILKHVAWYWTTVKRGHPAPIDFAKDARLITDTTKLDKKKAIDLSTSNRFVSLVEEWKRETADRKTYGEIASRLDKLVRAKQAEMLYLAGDASIVEIGNGEAIAIKERTRPETVQSASRWFEMKLTKSKEKDE